MMQKISSLPARMAHLCLLIGVIGVLGCGGGSSPTPLPDLVEVTGQVTVNDKPVEFASVIFTPVSGGDGSTSAGTTDAEGRFQLLYDHKAPGAVPGKHLIRIEILGADGDPDLIPLRYRREQSSGLTADVTKEGPNDFTFELKGK